MDKKVTRSTDIDLDKYRLRSFVQRMIEMGEVEVREEHVPLTKVSEIVEAVKGKAVLFKKAGPEKVELVAKIIGGRKRVAAAFGVPEDKVHEEMLKRIATPQKTVEIPSSEAPVHEIVITGDDIDLSKLPFHPQHEFDGSCYISSGIDYTIDPVSGRTNVGSRRLSLRSRNELGTNITAPSDLKRMYTACVARGEKLPVTFTIGQHPLDMFAATTRKPGEELNLIASLRGETAAVVRSITNKILVPADAEVILEGYLDERGYVEPEGPYGEYMGYYGAIHMDPVFHCTAITMRRDAMHQTMLHGSAFDLDMSDGTVMSAMRTEAEAMRILRQTVKEPLDVYLCETSGGSNTLRVKIRQRVLGEARSAIASLFGGIMRLKHVFVFDEDIDLRDQKQVEWAMGTRFQADTDLIILQGMVGMTMDPSLEGRRTGAKAGFDCTRPTGRDGEIPLVRCAAKVFKGPAKFKNVEDALKSGPLFYSQVVEGVGSDDGREVALALDALRKQGKLGRDRDGRYHLVSKGTPGTTTIVGELYHDPNHGT
jgi:2,5-furandicarboxylate decarboxylase 1